ncbi:MULTISPECIES: DUF4139 domain-containing protein [unclassified Roseovarius]|uniref:DUF4139 domain-containing protein n=1 Tax=unclassified Roseovarius TaxID=2614913 RepID=UPI00273EE979|nr:MULTISPECIES: DUF4139 domain-containing protein [unclassified Roseovarius]
MRALPIVLAFFPTFVLAEDIALTSAVTAATLYPQGATVTREIPFEVPAGQHELILTDLPQGTPLDTVRVSVEGVTMGSLTVRNDFVPPRSGDDDAAIKVAEAEVERIEEQLRLGLADVERITLEGNAAEARVAFLSQLGEGEGVAELDVSALRDLVGMIGEETLAAEQAALDARLRADAAQRGLKDLREALEKARQALQALVPEDKARAMLAVSVSAADQTQGMLSVTYNIWEANWQPVYDVTLERASGQLEIERGALIAQGTGENWRDVNLTLSTVRPSEQTAPGQIWPWQRWIEDPAQVRSKQLERVQDFAMGAAADVVMEAEAPPMVEEAAAAFDGLAVTYSYPSKVSVASRADNVRIALGDLSTSAEIVAQAVPLTDSNAFLMAGITNDMGELILPGTAMFYMDGRFIGRQGLELIPAGAEAELSFGPIDGLRLTRTVLDRNEGDRGIITKSNELSEAVEIKVENLTGEAWPVRLLDRVPFSEQEDLEISWMAKPRPTEENVDGKRGIMAWEFELDAGANRLIELDHALEWPEGKVLR